MDGILTARHFKGWVKPGNARLSSRNNRLDEEPM
jgi:hypothetical protein